MSEIDPLIWGRLNYLFPDTLWKKAKEKILTKHPYVLAACLQQQLKVPFTQNINILSSFILHVISNLSSFILHVISNLFDCLFFVEQKKNSEQCSGGCFLLNYNKKGLKLQEGQEITLRYHKIGLYKSCAIFQVFRSLYVRNTEMKVLIHWKSH